MCTNVCMLQCSGAWVREQLMEISFLPACGSQALNPGLQAGWQMVLPAEPTHWPSECWCYKGPSIYLMVGHLHLQPRGLNDFFRSHLLAISWSKSPYLILLLCHFYDPFKTSELLRVNLKDVKATAMASTVEKLHNESFLYFPWSLKFGGKLFKIRRPTS